MNDYDTFMNEMLSSGWSWEEANQIYEDDLNRNEKEYGVYVDVNIPETELELKDE